MYEALQDIQEGRFAKNWLLENQVVVPSLTLCAKIENT